MIDAYKAGIPGDGTLLRDGAKWRDVQGPHACGSAATGE
jgi:hypothetical protein